MLHMFVSVLQQFSFKMVSEVSKYWASSSCVLHAAALKRLHHSTWKLDYFQGMNFLFPRCAFFSNVVYVLVGISVASFEDGFT